MSKYQIGDKVFCFTNLHQNLVAELEINGIIKRPDDFYYSNDLQNYIREIFLFADSKDAYQWIIQKAVDEMNGVTACVEPESMEVTEEALEG